MELEVWALGLLQFPLRKGPLLRVRATGVRKFSGFWIH